MARVVLFLLISLFSAVNCFITIPTIPTPIAKLAQPFTDAAKNQLISNYTLINPNITNGIEHGLCEKTPTHLVCGASVKYGHKVLQNLPAPVTIRSCMIFAASPHCCASFCLPGNGGTCNLATGACFCNPSGVPTVCELIMKTKDSEPALLNNNDNDVLNICADKCANNPNGCTKPAAASDGIVGTVCMCYCSPNGDAPEETTPTPSIGLPTF